jgi:hypothetical protein
MEKSYLSEPGVLPNADL